MTTTTTAVEELERAALAYAEAGWPPFPLHPIINGRCGCIERSCASAGKHPASRGWQRSLASPKAAASIWRPDAQAERGIGLALGPRAGLWVLDIDGHGGWVSLARLEAEHGPLPATWEVETGGGGGHRYWAWPDDGGELRNGHGTIAPGLDVKGSAGFAVAPPSLHISGRRYEWIARPGDRPRARAGMAGRARAHRWP